jgi:hypothetical protein
VRLLGYVDGLSRVLGDGYARFCGGGVMATSSRYPTTYLDRHLPLVTQRLTQAGIRLGHLLNRALDGG